MRQFLRGLINSMDIQLVTKLVNAGTHNRLRELTVSKGDNGGFDLEGISPSFYVKSLAQETLRANGLSVGINRINVVDPSKNTFVARQELDFVREDGPEILLETEAA